MIGDTRGQALGDFPTGILCNASEHVRVLDSAIKILSPGTGFLRALRRRRCVAGPAKTARVVPGHNAAIHRAVYSARPGDVLVVDGGGSRSHGPFGDILAAARQRQGIAGLVIDGMIRDSAEVHGHRAALPRIPAQRHVGRAGGRAGRRDLLMP